MSEEYNCGRKCNCSTFRKHVGFGPYVASSAMPTRAGEVLSNRAREKKWDAEGEAYTRLYKQGYELPSLKNADVIESRATTEFELKTGELHGQLAPVLQEVAEENGMA